MEYAAIKRDGFGITSPSVMIQLIQPDKRPKAKTNPKRPKPLVSPALD
jgi:hypothetical protein